jgi:alkylation response protein AidB-like acyl-CoA dehydrogenase
MNVQHLNAIHSGQSKYLERACSLADLIDSQAEASDQGGTMTPPVVNALREAELFWLLVPKEAGGPEVDIITALDVWEEVSRADASAGWSLMANAAATAIAAAYCSDEAVEVMFGSGKRPIMAGMLGPGGTVVEIDGGYRGSGKYKFGSGCRHADWFGAGMFVMDDNVQCKLPTGEPAVRVCFLPRDQVQLASNWDVFGLRGTGSIDYEVDDKFVPHGFSLERTATKALRGGPIYDLGIAGFGAAGHTSVALGLMKRALQEVAKVAFGRKRPAYATVLGEHPVFRHEFAVHEASYQAARAFTYQVYAEAQDTVISGKPLSLAQRQRFRQNMIYVHNVAADVVRFCYVSGGSDALRNPSPLGRCMRDMFAATQHVFVDTINLVDAAVPILQQWRPQNAAA